MIKRKICEDFNVLGFLILGYLTGFGNGGSYCVYLHEDYYTLNQKYCESGCCKDYGDDDEICCFSWTIGIIIGICFAIIGFIALVAFLIICCSMMKKRSRNGHIINPMNQQTQNNMVVYTASAGYSYPHPPSGYYPGSRFPGFGAPPPPYTAGTQPAYQPTQMDQSNNGPPLPSSLYTNFQTRQPSAPSPADNTTQLPYGGYGTGQS